MEYNSHDMFFKIAFSHVFYVAVATASPLCPMKVNGVRKSDRTDGRGKLIDEYK